MDRRSQQGLDLELKPVMRIDETELQILWGVGSYFNRICEAKNGYASPLGENDKNFHHLNTRMYFPFLMKWMQLRVIVTSQLRFIIDVCWHVIAHSVWYVNAQ